MKRVKDTRTIVLDRNFQIAVACPRWVCLLVIPVCVCAYVRVFVKYFCLLNDFYFRSQSLQLLLELVRGLFLHVFLHDLRCRLDQFLCLLQPQTGDRPHLLDDLDFLLGVEAHQLQIEDRLLLGGLRLAGGPASRCRLPGEAPAASSRLAPLGFLPAYAHLLVDDLGQQVDLDHVQPQDLVEDLLDPGLRGLRQRQRRRQVVGDVRCRWLGLAVGRSLCLARCWGCRCCCCCRRVCGCTGILLLLFGRGKPRQRGGVKGRDRANARSYSTRCCRLCRCRCQSGRKSHSDTAARGFRVPPVPPVVVVVATVVKIVGSSTAAEGTNGRQPR
mmetsp:Transcript_3899/g.8908  ORF Transcript_3899/g.8908 Transcript_3899/m.8908 type:complete len:329 (-) Transcript_3899:203-1189(-)